MWGTPMTASSGSEGLEAISFIRCLCTCCLPLQSPMAHLPVKLSPLQDVRCDPVIIIIIAVLSAGSFFTELETEGLGGMLVPGHTGSMSDPSLT